jgi:uncharacterized protein
LDVRKLVPADEPVVEAFLLPRLASSMFLLGNMRAAGLIDRGERFCGTYVGAFEDGALVGVVAHCWNGNLIPQAGEHVDVLWRAAVAASGRRVAGAIGPADQVTAIWQALNALAEDRGHAPDIRMDAREPLFQLALSDLVVPDALQSGRVTGRLAAARDLETLVAWRFAYEVEMLGAAASAQLRAGVRAGVARQNQEESLWVLEEAGKLVAVTGFNTRTAEAVQVGGVYTPPELRRRGYGRCAVAASLLAVREAGVGLGVLFTSEHNFAAQRAYTALGFHQVGAFRLLMLRQPLQVGTASA